MENDWKRLVPIMWRLFSLAGAPPQNREFTIFYTDTKTGEENKPQRHISFATEKDFLGFMEKRKPLRLDIGPAMAVCPRFEKFCGWGEQVAVASEFKADIDIDSYDFKLPDKDKSRGGPPIRPGRTCCSGRDTCTACWNLVNAGATIIDAGLRSLGAKRIAWFFSGGRGMHCWVFDGGAGATFSSPDRRVRECLAERIAPANPVTLLDRIDPVATEIICAMFPCLAKVIPRLPATVGLELPEEDMFLGWYVDAYPASAFYAMSKRMKAGDVCDDIGFAGIKKYGRLAYRRKKPITDAQERKQVADVIDRIRQRIRIEASGLWPPPPRGSLTRAIVEAGLWSLMPRIDREVTEQPGHLLKAPLTLHPLTKKLAIFVKQADLATFVPSGDGSDAPARLADFDEWLSRK